MFKSITFKTIYSILFTTIRRGFKKFTNDNDVNTIVLSRMLIQNNSHRTIRLEEYSIEKGYNISPYNLINLIENIYTTIHSEKYRIILFQNKIDYSLATKISLSHGYNKNIMIFQENHNILIYIKAVYAIYEYARNN